MAKWNTQTFIGLHDVPPDPVYVAFAEGLFQADEDLGDQRRHRWSSRHEKWFVFPLNDWIIENTRIPDTPLPYGFNFGSDNADPLDFSVTMWLPDLFRKVQAVYAANGSRWPFLVWGLHGGGDWQNATSRPKVPPTGPLPPGPTTPGPGPSPGLSEGCLKRIADVRAFERRGDISSAQATKMIEQIVYECTVGSTP